METITLTFPSIVELVDFSLAMQVKCYEVNRSKMNMTAAFSEADIDLAVRAYGATKLEPA